jgi:5-methylcytosine-specific restriction enzyme subunit McrC
MSRIIIQVFEHGKLSVGEAGFKESHFKQLVKLNERYGNQYFSVGNNRIYFTQYVGVVQIGDLIIEILPKADQYSLDKAKWQRAFMVMLRESGLLKINTPTRADLKLKSASIIDLFIEHFISEVEKLIRIGMVKKYRIISNNSSSLKGKLLFSEQIKYNLIHKERFFNQYAVYDRDNVYNKIITKALRVLEEFSLNDFLFSKVKNLLINLENISDINVTDSTFTNLTYDRKTEGYRRAVDIAKMILLNYSPDIQSGKDNLLSLLFDMNDIFERFIFHRMKKVEHLYEHKNLRVKPQQSKKFWNSKTIRPDIVIEYFDKEESLEKKVIVDTKWKVVNPKYPSDNDLKQIYTYNLHFGAAHGYLLYPKVGNAEDCGFSYHKSVAVEEEYSEHACSQMFIDMFDLNNLIKDNLGNEIVENVLDLKFQNYE